MRRLKADLHAHCGDDPQDMIGYSAEMLIDAVAQLNYEVLAIASHDRMICPGRLIAYAARRNILLLPAVELMVEGKHVVVLNPCTEHESARTFADLRAIGKRDSAFLAPHPFYPASIALGGALTKNIDLFDAVEYSSMYWHGINPNRKAVRLARTHDLPIVGTSDSHTMPYSDSTFTWLDAEKTVDGVIDAVRAARVQVETRPRALAHIVDMGYFTAREAVRGRLRNWLQGREHRRDRAHYDSGRE